MSIAISIPPFLEHLTEDVKRIEVDGKSVGECLDALIERFPSVKPKLLKKDGSLLRGLNIFVNGESAYPEELTKPVKDGDRLHITYVMVGG
jgi:molybdopterin converting factor small subunit